MGFETKEATITSIAGGWGTATISNCQGYIAAIEIKSGTATPTNAYDIQIDNVYGYTLYNNDTVYSGTAMMTCPALDTYFKYPVNGPLTIYGANMGSAKVSKVILYLDNY